MTEQVAAGCAFAKERPAALRSMDIRSIVESTRTDNTQLEELTKVVSLAQGRDYSHYDHREFVQLFQARLTRFHGLAD